MAARYSLLTSFLIVIGTFQLANSHYEVLDPIWNKYQLHGRIFNFRTVSIDRVRNKLYIGGANALYELNVQNVTDSPKTLYWTPEQQVLQTCINFKKDEILCQNHVGVLQPINETHLYACGTMAYSAVCTYVRKENFSLESAIDEGKWKTPFNPDISTVSVFAHQTLFTATQDRLQGNNGYISRTLNGVAVRSLESDKYWLNDPVFISGHHARFRKQSQDKVVLFFREKAEEFQPYHYGFANSPTTRNIVSRIATVCVNDHGGSPWTLSRRFATYQKMTIVCNGQPDSHDANFRYTHLESTFVMENEQDPYNPTIFGVFTMPNDAFAGSAVCAYRMNDIVRALLRNRYWNRHTNDGGVEVQYGGDYLSGPGMCVDETRELSQSRLTFSQNHPIKFGVLFPSYGYAFYQEASTRYRYVVVHKLLSHKSSVNDNVTVLYMITKEGRLKRVVIPSSNPKASWSLPDIQAVRLESNEHVIKLEIGETDLLVITNRSITQIPLAACSLYETCRDCRDARDPYCILGSDETCASVFGLQTTEIEDLRRNNSNSNTCTKFNYVAPPVNISENDMIGQLQANISYLMQRNAEAIRNVAALTLDRNRRAEAQGACSENLQIWMHRARELDERLADVNGNLDSNQQNLTQSRDLLYNCNQLYEQQKQQLNEKGNELRSQRAEFDNVIQRLRIARTMTLRAAGTCEEEKQNLTRKANNCSSSLSSTKLAYEAVNRTCARRRNLELTAARAQLITVNNQMKIMRRAMGQFVEHRNYSSIVSSERGQQSCQYNGWFQSNESGDLYLLGKMRANFEDSKAICEALGGELAVFTNDAELRYITNVIRAYEPRKSFWIGLVKRANGTLAWHNGTPLASVGSKFPESQRSKMLQRSKFCVEINSYQRWTLTPCVRIRKPICQKVLPANRSIATARSSSLYRRFV